MKKETRGKSKFFDVDALLEQTENKNFMLYGKSRSLADEFDSRAEALREEFSGSCFCDVYYEKMRDLRRERLEKMTEIGKCITAAQVLIHTTNDRHEQFKILNDLITFLAEYSALLNQCERAPWAVGY